jgi:hypothetical protein
LSGQEDEIVEAFINARLLTSSELDGEPVVEVAHEALLRQWPPLAAAIERDREELQLRAEIERAATDWQRSGRRDEYLLSAERLVEAGHLSDPAGRMATDLTDVEQAFLNASQDRQLLLEAAKARRTRRTFAGLAAALVAVSALAIVALILGGQARDQRDIVTDQRNTAQAERLATDALGGLAIDPGQSLLYGMRAYAKKRTPLAEGALRVAVSQATPQLILRGNHRFVNGVAVADDGRHVATADDDGAVRVWDWRAPRTPPSSSAATAGA